MALDGTWLRPGSPPVLGGPDSHSSVHPSTVPITTPLPTVHGRSSSRLSVHPSARVTASQFAAGCCDVGAENPAPRQTPGPERNETTGCPVLAASTPPAPPPRPAADPAPSGSRRGESRRPSNSADGPPRPRALRGQPMARGAGSEARGGAARPPPSCWRGHNRTEAQRAGLRPQVRRRRPGRGAGAPGRLLPAVGARPGREACTGLSGGLPRSRGAGLRASGSGLPSGFSGGQGPPA